MKNILTLSILFTLLCFKTNAQTTKPVLKFKNSILYQNDEKIFSYKPNGEILIFDYHDGSISMKLTVSAPNGDKLNLDTLNLDALTNKIMQIQQGIGQYESWVFIEAIRYEKGKIKSNTLYSNGGRTALRSTFDKDGRPIEKGNYIDNKKDGEWLKYDENGKIARKENYNDGVRSSMIYYSPNGKIGEIEKVDKNNYSNIKYYENGNIGYKKELINGNGEEIVYNEAGDVTKKDVYENGKDITAEKKAEKFAKAKITADSIAFYSRQTTSINSESNDKELPFTIVEQMPSFPGGETEKTKFLQDNLIYPQNEKEAGISGTVYLKFIVEKDGSISSIELLRGIGGGANCNKEAIRVVSSMPRWEPGKQNGKTVRVQMNFPVKFVLQ